MADSFLCIKKPKRCLTAYNLFFHSERQKLMDELQGNKDESGDKEQDSEPKKGKIGFAPLAQKISARWKVITDEDKAHFEHLAKVDRIRYDKEMENWRAAQAKLERLLQDAPEVALAALQSQKSSSDKKRKRKSAATKKEKKPKAAPSPPKKTEEKVQKKPAALSAPPLNLKKSAAATGLLKSQCTEAAQTQAFQFPKRTVTESNVNTHFSVPRMVSNNELPQARSVNMFCNNGNNANETFSGPRQVSVMQLGAWKNHGHDSTTPTQMQGNGNIASQANATFPFLPSPPRAYHPQQPQQSATSPMTTFQQEMLFGNDASSTPAFHTSFPKQDSAPRFSNRSLANVPTTNGFQQGQQISDDSFRSEFGQSFTTDELNVSCNTTTDWWGWSHHQGQDHVQDSASHHQQDQQAFFASTEPIYNDGLNFQEAFSQIGQEEAIRVMRATQMSLAASTQQANGHFDFPCFGSIHTTDDTSSHHHQQSNDTVSVATNFAFNNSA